MPRVLAAVILLAAVVAALVIVLGSPSRAAPRRTLESIFQDDDHLIYASTATVSKTLDTLKALGVQRIRATVLWRAIAPDPKSLGPPADFDATNPAEYPASEWAPYDRLVRLAGARGIGVDFNLSAPGPLWAMSKRARAPKYSDHWEPDARAFGWFVTAVARRYSGEYAPPGGATLPRVSYWSIWNEPNQPGWLAPQWGFAAGHPAMVSPFYYRQYVDAAFAALERTGHGPATDTILIGELAPEGTEGTAPEDPIPPLPFLRALYCVDASYRPLTGAAAAARGCPATGAASAFVSSHPGLFDATGFAHHPYDFDHAPKHRYPGRDNVTLSGLPKLTRARSTATVNRSASVTSARI